VDDVSLVPVEHQPDFDDVSLVPVEHDPFSGDGLTRPPQAQPQSVPPHPQQPPSSASSSLSGIGPPLIGDGGQFSAGTAFGNNAADVASKVAYGVMKQVATWPQRAIDASAADVQHLGDHSYTPQSIGPAVEAALMMMGGASAVPAAANELRAGLTIRRSPASRAAEKGHAGIGTTPNGGPTFVGTDHLYPAGEGQRNAFKMPLTGSRKADVNLANEMGGFAETPAGFRWHHVDDFDPETGMSSIELVKKEAHEATYPHAGSVSQWEKFHGRPYKR
jgi:hypothetical protein